jgi:hypothetical protein
MNIYGKNRHLRQAAKRWQKILSNIPAKKNQKSITNFMLTVGKAETATKNNLKVGDLKFT